MPVTRWLSARVRTGAVPTGRARLRRAGGWAARAGRSGLVALSLAVVSGMVAAVVSGPVGDRVLARDRDGLWDGSDPVAVHWWAPSADRVPSPRTGTGRTTRRPATMRADATEAPARPVTRRLAGTAAVCVRLCDGYFFPAGRIGNESEVDDRAAVCAGLCPDAPTRLFVGGRDGDIRKATAADTGQPYTRLPVAFAHTREVGPTCACHPAAGVADASMRLMRDVTLRGGDSVMTPVGWRVFRETARWPYGREDFVPLRSARNLTSRTRALLLAVEDVSLGRRVAALAPLRVRLAASDRPAAGGPVPSRPTAQALP